MTTTPGTRPRYTYLADGCRTAHVGGYGDCVLLPHDGPHEDAFGHLFTDEDNARILADRIARRAAADAKRDARLDALRAAPHADDECPICHYTGHTHWSYCPDARPEDRARRPL